MALEELFRILPIAGEAWWIYVERITPKVFARRLVAGVLRHIEHPITLSEWQERYGGGTYKLIVMGPSKRTGHRLSKITEPIVVHLAGIPKFSSMTHVE